MSISSRLPTLALILIALGAIAFVNKDRLFPPSPEAEAKKAAEARPQGRRGGQGRGPVAITAATAKTADVPVYLRRRRHGAGVQHRDRARTGERQAHSR